MKPVLMIVFAAFGLFSAYAIWQFGYFGIWQAGMRDAASWQLLLDLLISASLLMGLLWRDARASRRRFWPFLALTAVAGSFGPLLYLILDQRRTTK